ncbi:FG-GAP-like repeat-containing protein [Nocardioides alcanivorans]|uniref:FG-GAP-like repeat-containing protein n=1 Tax=Nocardioides alcanivorans TaxID=2897352 RepID=UPI001F1C6DD5|nr:FG-GAP-like repeat-containing protein [Nocardioides alcanivorans]
MRPNKARFVSACQQLLVLGAVFAVLVPAANVVSLDVITALPRESARDSVVPLPGASLPSVPIDGPAGVRQATEPAEVETAPVEPVVEEHPMETEDETVAVAPRQHLHSDDDVSDEHDEYVEQPESRSDEAPATGTTSRTIISDPEKVHGYGAVGVTWSPGAEVGDDDITVEVRTSTNGVWTEWAPLDYHEEHGPDASTAEGQRARPGTDALIVGDVDEVQARATTADGVVSPSDLRMAVVAPGESAGHDVEAPEIDTAKLRQGDADADTGADVPSDGVLATDQGDIALQATTVTDKPKIFSRAQWGANEKLRDGSPSYYEVHAGFVHHTANANDYTKAQVPGIIRSIYAYHTKSRGWSDIGYNFLVDRFGRIWEGRYGGVDLPVVGAHTLNYNNYSFAMSAIGNFDITKPGSKIVQAYGSLMAWKLALHGVDASSTKQQVGSRTFPAINGHRDAASTACPGRYLYAKLAKIRKLAAKHQADWSGRELATNVVGGSDPDLLLRKKDGTVYAVPTGGMLNFDAATTPAGVSATYRTVVASPDLTGDGRADVLAIDATGTSWTLPGTAAGTGFASPVKKQVRFVGHSQVTAVGDLDKDGRNDVVARNSQGNLMLFRGNGKGGFKKGASLGSWSGYDATAATGDVNGDKVPDVLARDSAGKLWLHPGTGRAALGPRKAVNGAWGRFDVVSGFGDVDGDGKADLLVRDKASQVAWVRPGRGNGTFGKAFGPLRSLKGLTSVSAGAVGGTSRPDMVVLAGGKLRVLKHSGTRNVGTPVNLGSGFSGSDVLLNVGDWDRDGIGDIVTRNAKGNLRLHRGLGNDRFASPKKIGTGFTNVTLLAAVGDVTGDGFPDLMGQPKGSSMRVYPGSGSGLRSSFVARGSVAGSAQLGLGRWNADGAPDVLVRNGSALTWYQGNGPGGLTGAPARIATDVAAYDLVLSPGDVTRDGRQDLVVRTKGKGQLWVLPGTSKGFGSPILLATGFKGYDLAG